MKKLIAGNWKMNGSLVANELLVSELLAGIKALPASSGCEVAVCVPAPYLAQISSLINRPFLGQNTDPALVKPALSAIDLGAQDMSTQASGAFTGEVSGGMLKEFGVRYCLVGHSERRRYHGETDQIVSLKAKAALANGITPIVCVGETLDEREAGQTEAVVKRQLAAVIHDNGHCISEIVLAYEPVWAIGTGKTATPEQAQAVHAVLRAQLTAASSAAKQRVRILYGGSMNAANAAQLLAQTDIDGGLIGGASLKATDFMQIVAAALVKPAPSAT